MDIKILVVDDSGKDRQAIESALVGYTVLSACDGHEALRAIKDNPDIDIMLLDLNMPNMDGFQVLGALKSYEHYNRLCIIILTDDDLESEIKGLQLGAVDYIRKPIHSDSLKVRIDTHAKLLCERPACENEQFDKGLTLNTIFQQAPIGIAISHNSEPFSENSNTLVSINPAYEQISGRSKEELIKLGWANITHPDDIEEELDNFNKLKSGEIKSYSMEKRFIRPDGSIAWVDMVVVSLAAAIENKTSHICLVHDITQRKNLELSLIESERSKSVLLSNLPGMAYRCNYDRDWTMQFVSDGCFKLTGYKPEDLLYNKYLSFNDLISPEYRETLWKEWERILPLKIPFQYEYEITTADGQHKWVLEMGEGIYNEHGEVEALEGIVFDISRRKEMENNLRYMLEHERWTRLLNRDYLEKLLESDSQNPGMNNRALIGINLSPVYLLTKNYGFHYTLKLIKNAAETLSRYCTDERMLFCTFENRFVFYLKNYKDRDELLEFTQAIAGTLDSIFETDRVGGGIGILEINQYSDLDADLLLRKLLIASERSISIFDKDHAACFYDDDLEALVIREGVLRQELARIAADNTLGEFYLNYQPILDLKSNSICGFEVLARLNTEKLGFVSPVEFIPIAEETKLIIPIGEKVFVGAFCFLNKLKALGYETIKVSVNVSAIQLLRPDFTDGLFELINKMHVNPSNIIIEITESVFAADYAVVNGIISKLKDVGLHVAIDDFGTGYSSLAREKELNVNCLKIDKFFIDKLLEIDSEKAITGDIISMAHRLGHYTIAEGVENEAQRQYLLANGCDMIQGYLISRPLEENAAIELLNNQLNYLMPAMCDRQC